MYRSECFSKYANGSYRYKNGIKILRTNRGEWTIYYCCGEIAAVLPTLKVCKRWLGFHYR